ncbi:deacetylase EF_0837-like isoform X2 [Dreissena polymorpha]|uniref:deacetylase EF_0837-like isoform X2 n=1 Tax=Dreissena polymorpha TaxID=45954 RepID=UPI0022649CCD|nr:deacetylase EF_0837-like isoform X2 [Dreissena polymorpha]
MEVDLLIENGRVIDPANNLDGQLKVAINNGATTFMGLRKYVVERSKTRVKCLLHIALHGLAASGCSAGAGGGESDTLAVLDEDACAQCINYNRDVIVGVKVRLSLDVCNMGKTENEAFRRALAVAERCSVPLMTHHSVSTVPTQKSLDPKATFGCPGDLRAGDIYTHTFHGYPNTIIDVNTGQVHSDVIDARSRGVLFDVGHGAGAMNWTVAELATSQNFFPDMLGSDLHLVNKDGPAYDLPTVMTKFLHLGMPLVDIINSVTSSPAKAYGIETETGSLTKGLSADVTVLKIEECDVMLEDSVGQTRNVRQRIKPIAVWREGEQIKVTVPVLWPNPDSIEKSLRQKSRQEINDDIAAGYEPRVSK